ncbi:MAG: radical SAM protein [Deltaproteobacteria bacterium]|nr:radical SAM protein [Deltaproteobacteria bacterium]
MFTDENISKINYNIKPSLVVLSAMTCYFGSAIKIAQIFKQKGIPVICGGIHVSLYKNIKDHPFSSIVIGEGEYIWREILNDHQKGSLKPVYNNDQHSPLIDINYEKVNRYIDFSKYCSYPIQTTRGCPFNCNFCTVTEFNGKETRHRQIENIVNEIKYVQKTNHEIIFVDDNIIGDKKFAKDLFEALAKQNIFWGSQSSINIAFEKDLLELAAQAGCEYLFLGFESTQKESLQLFNKQVNLSVKDKYNEIFPNIRSHGIEIVASFILGNDSDNGESFRQIIDFIEDNNIIYAMVNILTPLPGTELFNTMDKASRIIDYNFTHYDAQHAVFSPAQMSASDLEKGLCLIYKDIYNLNALFRRTKATLCEYKFFNKRNSSKFNISFFQIITYLRFILRFIYQLFLTNSLHVLIDRLIFVFRMFFLLFDNKVREKKNIFYYLILCINLNDFSRDTIKQIQKRY